MATAETFTVDRRTDSFCSTSMVYR